MSCSRVIEGILFAQLKRLVRIRGRPISFADLTEAYILYDFHRKDFEPSNYIAESYINQYLGINLGDVYQVYLNNTIDIRVPDACDIYAGRNSLTEDD